MIYHNKLVLSAIAASFIVSTGGGGFMRKISATMLQQN